MIGSSKNNRKIIRENAFEHKKKKPGLSANRPSNNWALGTNHNKVLVVFRGIALELEKIDQFLMFQSTSILAGNYVSA